MIKKILFVANTDMHINLCYLPYIKYLKEQGYIVHVATNTNILLDYSDKKIQIPIHRTPLKLGNIKAIFKLKKIINEEKYDLISTSTPMGGVVARLASIRTRKENNTKLIYTAHGFHFFKGANKISSFIYFNVEKVLMKFTDILITINKEDYLNALKYFKVDTRYIKGIGYSSEKLQITLTKKEKKLYREKLGLEDNDYVITYIAELSKRKRQKYLINTLSKMDLKNIKILLVGNDNIHNKIYKLIKRKRLENNIKLLGFRNDISEILDISDLIISVSKQEGLPLNIMEAMHKNKPIIVTDCRGNRDLIKNGENGIIVKLNDKGELIDNINYLKNNKKIAKRLGTKNKNIIDEYSINNILNEYVKIYDEILNEEGEV